MAIAIIGLSVFFTAIVTNLIILKHIEKKISSIQKRTAESYLHLGKGMILIDGEYRKF